MMMKYSLRRPLRARWICAAPVARRLPRLWLWTLPLFALQGCDEGCIGVTIEGFHDPCTTGDECAEGMACINDRCEIPCVEDEDCPDLEGDWECSPYNGRCFENCGEK